MNEILRKLVREKGTNKQVAGPLGITPQALGNYIKHREIPLKVVTKWKEVYGDDLIKMAGETNVSRETKGETKTMDMDVWEVIKGSSKILELEFDRLWGLIDRLVPPQPQVNNKKETQTKAE